MLNHLFCPLPLQVCYDAATPTTSMKNPAVRHILSEQLVRLALSNHWGVTAVRFTWPNTEGTAQGVWDNISALRAALDKLMAMFPDWVLFVSGVSGSLGPQRKVRPSVGYWLVTRSEVSDCRAILAHVQANQCGATPKLLLQPYQKTEKDFTQVLYTLVKDNVGGCVPRMVQDSRRLPGGLSQVADWESVVQIHLKDRLLKATLDRTVGDLSEARFPIPLILHDN